MKKTIIFTLIFLFLSNNLLFGSNNNISNGGQVSIQGIEENPVPTVIALWLLYKLFFDQPEDNKTKNKKYNPKCKDDKDNDGICDDIDTCVGEFDCLNTCNGTAEIDKNGVCCRKSNIDDCGVCYGKSRDGCTGCKTDPKACNFNPKAVNIVPCEYANYKCQDGRIACSSDDCDNCEGTQKYQEKYTNGKLKVEGLYKNCEKHGNWKWYYKSKDQIEKSGEFKNGKEIGEWVEFHLSGRKKTITNFKKGKKDGRYFELEDLPRINNVEVYIIKGSYKNDKKDGTWSEFYADKSRKSISYYISGKKTGKWLEYYNNQKNSKKFEGTYNDDLESGSHEWYYKNGALKKSIQYNNGVKSGKHLEYYNDGTPKVEGRYKSDEKSGTWIYLCDNGDLKEEREYNKGKQVGKYAKYYCSGNLHVSGRYKNGEKCGKWIFYEKNGKKDDMVEYDSCF